MEIFIEIMQEQGKYNQNSDYGKAKKTSKSHIHTQ